MRDSITPEMAVNYAVNLTHSQSANLGDIIYLMEDPTRIKSNLLSVSARREEAERSD